jgi:hypothetical protein
VEIVNDKDKPETGECKLWGTDEVMAFTGWGRTYISRLCTTGVLPHIPGKPHRFIPSEVKNAILQMQVGGRYGKKKKGENAQMKAIVTECPVKDTEALAEMATAESETETAIHITLGNLKHIYPELTAQIDALDDLYLKASTEAQNTTLRKLICSECNARTVCTPEQK